MLHWKTVFANSFGEVSAAGSIEFTRYHDTFGYISSRLNPHVPIWQSEFAYSQHISIATTVYKGLVANMTRREGRRLAGSSPRWTATSSQIQTT